MNRNPELEESALSIYFEASFKKVFWSFLWTSFVRCSHCDKDILSSVHIFFSDYSNLEFRIEVNHRGKAIVLKSRWRTLTWLIIDFFKVSDFRYQFLVHLTEVFIDKICLLNKDGVGTEKLKAFNLIFFLKKRKMTAYFFFWNRFIYEERIKKGLFKLSLFSMPSLQICRHQTGYVRLDNSTLVD